MAELNGTPNQEPRARRPQRSNFGSFAALLLLTVGACGGDDTPQRAAGDAAIGVSHEGGLTDASIAKTMDASSHGGATADGGTLGAADASVDAATLPSGPDSSVRDPGTQGDGDFTIDTYTIQPDLTDKGAPKGKRFHFTMDSTKSQIFDGSDKTLDPSKMRSLTRDIDVYVPARYVDGSAAPFLVIQDGPGPIDEFSRALDNLTIAQDATRKIPAFVVIAVQNGGNDAQGSERGLEYDTMSDRYARFIQMEVLPAVLADVKIKAAYPKLAFTSDPEGRATYGCSSGAAAAYTMAWFRPDWFRRVLSYSGTFVAQQDDGQPEAKTYPLGAWEYHSDMQLIANADVKPVRAFLNVNENDLGSTAAESGHHNWVIANQRMAAALRAKNYHYRYVFAKGLGHCDAKARQATLADALIWMWAGYPVD